MKKAVQFLTLFSSASTLVCCAIPALFVVLGVGAAFAGIVGAFPQIVWLSENKPLVFGFGAVMLAIGGFLQWRLRAQACPIDAKSATACRSTRDWSQITYFVSLALYLVGTFFAFGAPLIL